MSYKLPSTTRPNQARHLRRISLLLVAVILNCANFGCFNHTSVQTNSAVAVATHTNSVEIHIGKEKAIFRTISPLVYKIDYPEFHLLETEVTNRMYREYVRATGVRKDDTVVLEIVRERKQPLIIAPDEINDVTVDNKTPLDDLLVDNDAPTDIDGWHDTGVGSGTTSVKPMSTGDISYEINDETTIWRDNNYPVGSDDHPVALVTLPEAIAFCEWLSQTHPDKGLFRLPTWNEWMIAAYGSARAYPWGDEWNQSLTHTSFGSSREEFKKRAEPVKARPLGRTPEGLYGMLGNVSEYLFAGDPTSNDYFNLGARWMGGGFTDGRTFNDNRKEALPRQDYWGYSHHSEIRVDDVGFRVLLDVKQDHRLLERSRLFDQKNNAWRIKSD